MDRAAPEAPVGPVGVAELHPRPVLVEACPLPFRGARAVAPRHARGADEGRQEVGGAPQREAAEQRPGHRPRQEREEVAGEEERPLEQEAARGGEQECDDEEGEGEEEEPEPGGSHGGGLGFGPAAPGRSPDARLRLGSWNGARTALRRMEIS